MLIEIQYHCTNLIFMIIRELKYTKRRYGKGSVRLLNPKMSHFLLKFDYISAYDTGNKIICFNLYHRIQRIRYSQMKRH